MIKKILNKIKEKGFKVTLLLIMQKIRRKIYIEYNPFYNKKNFLYNEWKNYWKAYNFIKRKYKKNVLNIEKKKGSGVYSNKVWWCWLQGEDNLPELQKKCLKSIKKHLIDREIIIITNENLYDYIELPEYIKRKYKEGIITNTHFSDLIRLQLLIKYGGTWIDSTAYCTGYDKSLFDKPLFVYKDCNNIWFANKNRFEQQPIIADSWFITAEVENPILIAVRDMLFEYWKDNNYLIGYFTLHYFFTLVVNYKYKKEFDEIPIMSNLTPHILQYKCLNEYNEEEFKEITKQSTFHKLTHKIPKDKIKENSFYNYILKNG